MKEYLLLLRGGPQYMPATSPDQQEPISPDWRKWMEELVKNGRFSAGQRLVGGTGTVLKGVNPRVTDGPFAEGKEVVAGYLIIKAHNLEEAATLVSGCPIFAHADASMEIREIAS